jgi:hypothetical protein
MLPLLLLHEVLAIVRTRERINKEK